MAGRRKGEPRRLDHDLFVGIRKWSQLDQARVRELYESRPLRDIALAFIEHIKKLAPDIESGALEGLAHSLIREELKTSAQKNALESD